MTNPYASPEVTTELAQEERKRPKIWRSWLAAYGVHHGFAVLGLFAGLAFSPTLWDVIRNPCLSVLGLIAIPILDLYLVTEPTSAVILHDRPRTGWTPAIVVITIALSGFWYGISRRRELLAYIAVASFVAAVWFMFAWVLLDRRVGH